MALDFDPIYHTETMVKILREQGSTLHAMELAEKILERDPGNASVRSILEELKTEARASFERFRQAGKNEKPETEEEAAANAESLSPMAVTESLPKTPPESASSPDPLKPQDRKIRALKGLLTQVQNYRRQNG